ncbi:CHASE domain-containing protein [Stappia sp.]|uniref:CHASE domain-containing protein n=1 Tax=Stappia sp. TaxID=1870903 RepID=UPI003A996FA6
MALIGACVTLVVYNAEKTADRIRFDGLVDNAVDRVVDRVHQHIALLISTHAFFSASSGEMSRPAFARFVKGLDLEGDFKGIRGIGYARLIETGDEQGIEQELLRNYALEQNVWPVTTIDTRAPITLLEPFDVRNRAALGYDMFSEIRRRLAMQDAMESREPRASAPVQLAQEITPVKQAGFLVYIPFSATPGGKVEGFVYSPFRAGDLHTAALDRQPQLPVALQTQDVTEDEPVLLYRSDGFTENGAVAKLVGERTVEIAGRKWLLSAHATGAFSDHANHLYSIVVGSISLLLALAFAMSTQFLIKSVAAAHALRAASEREIKEKDLMLQEMKHRIKNSIARILAIARQTAGSSSDIDQFSQSFTARLNAMANVQDMLTRSHWRRTDLRELLATELEQVFGTSHADEKIDGPPVLLDERATQALGLTFHELATNALKYGGLSDDGGDLRIRWEITGRRKARRLRLDWTETSPVPVAPPQDTGFGTRLIDANIRGELGGTLERKFGPTGMCFTMVIPLGS